MSDAAPTSDTPRSPGQLIAGKYRVLRLIGTRRHGYGVGGRARRRSERASPSSSSSLSSRSQPEARARFEIEARAAAKLKTKHAVHVYDYGVTPEGLPYIVMEFLEGESLSDAIIGRGPLPAGRGGAHHRRRRRARSRRPTRRASSTAISSPTTSSSRRATSRSRGCRTWSSSSTSGSPRSSRSRRTGRGRSASMGGPTREGTVIGTPNFMAPEQLAIGGAPGPLTDLWSLGACTFAAMTGRLPFEGDVLGDIVLKVCASPMPAPSQINPDVPPGFDAWFARACSRDPPKRFQTAEELAQALAGVCGIGRIRMATLDEDQVQYVMRPTRDVPSTSRLAAAGRDVAADRAAGGPRPRDRDDGRRPRLPGLARALVARVPPRNPRNRPRQRKRPSMVRDDERKARLVDIPVVCGLPDVPGIVAAMRLSPGLAVHLRGLADELLVKNLPGATLTRSGRELLATAVSAANDCFYCMDSHGAFASEATPSDPTRPDSRPSSMASSWQLRRRRTENRRRAARHRSHRAAEPSRVDARGPRLCAGSGRHDEDNAARAALDRVGVLHVQPNGRRPYAAKTPATRTPTAPVQPKSRSTGTVIPGSSRSPARPRPEAPSSTQAPKPFRRSAVLP